MLVNTSQQEGAAADCYFIILLFLGDFICYNYYEESGWRLRTKP